MCGHLRSQFCTPHLRLRTCIAHTLYYIRITRRVHLTYTSTTSNTVITTNSAPVVTTTVSTTICKSPTWINLTSALRMRTCHALVSFQALKTARVKRQASRAEAVRTWHATDTSAVSTAHTALAHRRFRGPRTFLPRRICLTSSPSRITSSCLPTSHRGTTCLGGGENRDAA
jgi:hypothetical protein